MSCLFSCMWSHRKPSDIWLLILTQHCWGWLPVSQSLPTNRQTHTPILHVWNIKIYEAVSVLCSSKHTLPLRKPWFGQRKLPCAHRAVSSSTSTPKDAPGERLREQQYMSLTTEVGSAPRLLQHLEEPRWDEWFSPPLCRDGSEVKGFGPGFWSWFFFLYSRCVLRSMIMCQLVKKIKKLE